MASKRKRSSKATRKELRDHPILAEYRRRRLATILSLRRDSQFQDETFAVRSVLEQALEFNPDSVRDFFERFPGPTVFALRSVLTYVRRQEVPGLRRALVQYVKYAHRFGSYFALAKRGARFVLRQHVRIGAKFHVRLRKQHLEPISRSPTDIPDVEFFESKSLNVPQKLQKLIDADKARYVLVEDASFDSVLNEFEDFAYTPDGITFIVHKSLTPYIFCMIGERFTKPMLREAGTALSALQREYFERGKGGRRRNRARHGNAMRVASTPGRIKEDADRIRKGDTAKDLETAVRYTSRARKKRREILA